MEQNNSLAKNFNMSSLLAFTLPSVFMMLFMSTYTIIDGVFVANLIGEDALAAINIVFPLFGLVMAVGLLFATGGNAVIARLLGEGKPKEANEFLTVLFIIGGAIGIVLSLCGFLFTESILHSLGVSDNLYPYAKDYLLSLSGFVVPVIFQVFVQSFLVTAGRPMMGFVLCVVGGLSNIVLDYLFISPNLFDFGIAGAGLATGIGNAVPGIFGFFYFIFWRKKSPLYFVKPKLKLGRLLNGMYNGMSELVNSLALSITTIMFNFILMGIAGDEGVAAISVILYIQQFQTAIYFGYTIGVSPIISYKFGANDKPALQSIVKKSFVLVSFASAIIIGVTLLFANQAVSIFISSDSPTFEMAKIGLLMFTPSYIFMGFNVFISAMFTALSNGKVSATLSVCRSLVFIVMSLMLLPLVLDIYGVWLAIPVAELLSIGLGLYFYKKHKSRYGY